MDTIVRIVTATNSAQLQKNIEDELKSYEYYSVESASTSLAFNDTGNIISLCTTLVLKRG